MIYALSVLLITTQVLDIYTTVVILKQGGRELNKPLAWLMSRLGVLPALLVTKVPVSGAFLLIAWNAKAPWGIVGLSVLVVFYGVVLANNFRHMRKAG